MSLKYISINKYKSIHCFAYKATYRSYKKLHVLSPVYLIILPKSQIYLHDYIIIS